MDRILSNFFKRNFLVTTDRFQHLSPALKREVREKVYGAEKNIAHLRLAIVLLNTVLFFLFNEKYNQVPWLALSVIVIAFLYSLWMIIFHPYRNYHILLTSYFTSSSDAILITFWLLATGGFNSPFYPLFYVSILAIALRYTFKATLFISFLYALIYLGLIVVDQGVFPEISEVVIRIGYLIFISFLGGLMSKETFEQIEAKLLVKKSEARIKEREERLIEAQINLEERVKERTKELDLTNKQLRKSTEDLDNFVYSVTHDLKSPIFNIKSLINLLLLCDPNNKEERELIKEKVEQSIAKVKVKIESIIEVAKSNAESFSDVEKLNVDIIFNEVLEENSEIIKESDAIVKFYFDEANFISFSVQGMKSILTNFLSNAIKYRSPDRQPQIEFSTLKQNGFIILKISDNGLGMNLDKNRGKLFSIFHRLHNHVEGAGIGLYMVNRLIERNNGKIEVDSVVDEGTTFKVYFSSAF